MNEVALHRGRHPHLTVVDAYFDGQRLTEAVVCSLLRPTAGFRLLLMLIRTGRWPPGVYSDRIHRLLTLRRRSPLSSRNRRVPPHSHRPAQSLLSERHPSRTRRDQAPGTFTVPIVLHAGSTLLRSHHSLALPPSFRLMAESWRY